MSIQDNRDLIGKGWPFPISPGDDERLHLISGEEKIRQSIRIILGTAPGERQMLPTFGCGIHDLPYQPNTNALRQDVERQVKEALVRWEPRIDVLDVTAETPAEAANFLLIRIDYRIRRNNADYNMVYPFFIDEGPR